MGGVAICAEANTSASEQGKERKGGIFTRFPSFPNAQRRLPFIHVARAFYTVFSVNLMTPVSAIAANDAVQAGTDCGNGIFRFAKDPNLDHVARFPVVGGFGEACCDDNPLGVLVENESVAHREPPIDSMRATIAMIARNPKRQRGPWNLGGMRSFIGFGCPYSEGARKEEHPLQRSATLK